ncbi:MAG: ABC transporter permease [Steroidobacteraceae bacterium]
MRVIAILWLRQLIRQARSRARILGALGQPVLFLVSFGFGFGPVFQRAGEGNYMQFLAPGVIGMGVVFSGMFSGMDLIWDKQFGFLRETLVAPVPRWQIMLGRTFGGATVALLQGLLVAIACLCVGFRPASLVQLPLALAFMLLAALMFTALGTAIASLVEDFHAFPLIMNFLVMPLFFLSGALFPLAGTGALAGIARFNPVAYAVDGLRGTLSGHWHFGFGADAGILCAVTLLIIAIGSWLFEKVEA